MSPRRTPAAPSRRACGSGACPRTASRTSAFAERSLHRRPSRRTRPASRRPRRRSSASSAARSGARAARPAAASRPSRRPSPGCAGRGRRRRPCRASARACRRRRPGGSGRRAGRCRAPRRSDCWCDSGTVSFSSTLSAPCIRPSTSAIWASERTSACSGSSPLFASYGSGPFVRRGRWNTPAVREALAISAVVGLLGVVAWIVLLLWAAREDGRDQERRDRDLPRP